MLGEHELALKANERAQELCKNILGGLKDLMQQNEKKTKQKNNQPKKPTTVFLNATTIISLSLQQLNLCVINYVVIIYGHATALLGIGQPEALAKAEDQFKKIIEQYQEERFGCLAYYGIGKVYLRQNRFSDALDQFMKSQTMVNHKIVPGVLTWPTTSQVIEETRAENLQLALKNCIEECKLPPKPDAICRYQQCHGHSKIQIFFTDPDFKGFIRITCCQQCRVEFHISCWKKLKTTNYSDKNDKDFLQELCFTPDCTGLISKIVIFSSSGLVKCESKLSIKLIFLIMVNRHEILFALFVSLNPVIGYVQDLYAGDRVLQHISRNAGRIKTAVCDASKLLKELLSWFVISEEDYMSYSETSSMTHDVMEQLISYLIQEKDRVKTRGFIHVLSELEEADPKLRKWLKDLNNLGLTATKNFLLQYGQFLQELDISILTTLWNEKYGSKFDYVTTGSEDKEIRDYFLKPPLEKNRCFIWLLEDNREHFPFLHQALDEFFDKMGKYAKVIVLTSTVLDFTNSYEPFVIPEYIRGQLEEFEVLRGISNSNSYQRHLDNNPDPTTESLYEYFSLILEQHGPMEINDKLLVGEYEHFPEEVRKIVEDEGGLKSFLLKSLRFIMVDNLIGLRKHEVLIQENTNRNENGNNEEENYIVCDVQKTYSFQNKLQLNPAAKEFKPLSYPTQPHISTSSDLTVASYETPQYLPCSFPASCTSVHSLQSHNIDNMGKDSLFPDILLKYILRMEKEHQVLKEQLKEAQEKYEQLQSRSSEETSALKEVIKRNVQETELSKTELDWFHRDLEMQVKKWQQEKKESQENFKALRSTAKKHTDTNESNKLASEKVKLEELIKKSQDDYQECVKRAVKAEISVLKNWKETEVCKLSGIAVKAETNLKMLKSWSSSASAAPKLKSQIESWEIFISNVNKQREKVKVSLSFS
uniref:RING-type E3 ubiquitin transferase n=1 Tax=Strigops habroptila TaxID=2489341 RepID=A0A672V3A0_STRHB